MRTEPSGRFFGRSLARTRSLRGKIGRLLEFTLSLRKIGGGLGILEKRRSADKMFSRLFQELAACWFGQAATARAMKNKSGGKEWALSCFSYRQVVL